MNSAAWISLFKRIPLAQHDKLSLVTTIGIELNIQNLMRLEEEYAVIRGRLAGTTDAGRLYFIPYDQINYLGVLRAVKEAEVEAMFGPGSLLPIASATPGQDQNAPALVTPAAAAEPQTPEPTPDPEAVTSADEVTPAPEPPKSGFRAIPDKAALLERLRLRARVGTSKPPSGN